MAAGLLALSSRRFALMILKKTKFNRGPLFASHNLMYFFPSWASVAGGVGRPRSEAPCIYCCSSIWQILVYQVVAVGVFSREWYQYCLLLCTTPAGTNLSPPLLVVLEQDIGHKWHPGGSGLEMVLISMLYIETQHPSPQLCGLWQ